MRLGVPGALAALSPIRQLPLVSSALIVAFVETS
jgi:hypothetical protein